MIAPATSIWNSPIKPSTAGHNLSADMPAPWTGMPLASLMFERLCRLCRLCTNHNTHFNLHTWPKRGGNISARYDHVVFRIPDLIIASLNKIKPHIFSAKARYHSMKVLQYDVNITRLIHDFGLLTSQELQNMRGTGISVPTWLITVTVSTDM